MRDLVPLSSMRSRATAPDPFDVTSLALDCRVQVLIVTAFHEVGEDFPHPPGAALESQLGANQFTPARAGVDCHSFVNGPEVAERQGGHNAEGSSSAYAALR
jgi:hypothetical protein